MELYVIEFVILFLLIGVLIPGRVVPYGEALKLPPPKQASAISIGLLLYLAAVAVVAGMRDISLGNDYHNYYDFYDYIYSVGRFPDSIWVDTEPGWAYLNYGFAISGVSPGVFFGLVSLLTWFIFALASSRFRDLLPLMFFFMFSIGMFYWCLSGLRQSIALVIFFYSVRFIVERKPLHYMVAICAAASFHNSALIMAPAYLLGKINYYKVPSFVIVASSLLLAGLLDLTALTGVASDVLASVSWLSKYQYYLNIDRFALARAEQGTYLGFWLKGVFFIWVAWQAAKVVDQQRELAVYANLFVIYSVLNNLFLSVELIGRLLVYPFFGVPVVAAASIYTSSNRAEQALSHLFLIAFALLFLASTRTFLAGPEMVSVPGAPR